MTIRVASLTRGDAIALRRVREAPDIDSPGPRAPQAVGKLGHRGAGGQHVIDDDDTDSRQILLYFESTPDVPATARPRETHLRTGVQSSSQAAARDFSTDTAARPSGDLRGLVESALKLASWMQGDREQQVDIQMQTPGSDCLGQQRSEHPAERKPAPVLE